MTWMKFADARRQEWFLQQEGLWLLCQQYAYAQLMDERAHVVPEKTPWYSMGPHINNVEIDFGNFHAEKVHRAEQTYDLLTRASLQDGVSVFNQLVQMKDELDLYTGRLAETKRRVARDNASSIENHVSFFGGAATVSRYVRDGAAAVLLVAASVATAGAAAGAAGVGAAGAATAAGTGGWLSMSAAGGLGVTAMGSGLKGLAAYEDSVLSKGTSWSDAGSIGAGLLQATATFMVSAIPIMPKLTPGGAAISKPVLLMITTPLNAFSTFAVGVAKGDSLGKSLTSTVVGLGVSALPLGDRLEKLAMPLATRLVAAPMAAEIVTKVGAGMVMDKVADAASDRVYDMLTAKPKPHVSKQVQHMVGVNTRLDRVLASDDYISRTVMLPASYTPGR
ncbi:MULTISPECIES: hypothetical protein [unclassified Rhodanobacter]|uniref:hypothetical protein n=1 Tax=unclassified Rhodanobacter TaxID=2621553 RepID=UPI001BDF4FEB|nr:MULTISPECIES: hypothetical protein [unclassified Rhodanobacter]MBT2143901.1 hypothetical protein [Rhodanobacter sp. LX-99]MBT2147025.1 hypothetical protein [Rhodanobacter sp. LX-100]